MNISKAEQFVNEAINRFVEVIEIPFAIPVYICARQEVDEERTKLMRSLGAEYEDFQDTTMGETINGVNGCRQHRNFRHFQHSNFPDWKRHGFPAF